MSIVGALPFTLQNGTTADATQVMADFNSIKIDVNAHAAANGANNDITSLAGLTTPLSAAQGGTGGLLPIAYGGSGSATPAPFVFTGGYRNIARRNGGLEIWQRGAGGSASFSGAQNTSAYTADGWYIAAYANEAWAVQQSSPLVNGSQFSATVFRAVGQTGTTTMLFGFPLDTDEIYPMLGQFVRLSLTLQAGANWSPASGNIGIQLLVGTGTPVKAAVGFTGLTAPISVTQSVTSSAVRYQFTSPLVVPTTTRQAEILLSWVPVGTAGAADAFTIDDVQLEVVPAAMGYTASNFERLNFEETLALCQRHYEKTFLYSTAPAQAANTPGMLAWLSGVVAGDGVFFQWRFSESKRVAPTVTLYSPEGSNAEIENITLGTACTGTGTVSSVNEARMSAVAPASTTAIQTMGVHATADSGI